MTLTLLRQQAAALAATLLMAAPAQASFVNLGDGTVLDTATNLVWLKDWNANGLANPDAQSAWASNLVFAGASNWVLPTWEQVQRVRADGGSLTDFSATFDHVSGGLYWTNSLLAPEQCPGDNLTAGKATASLAAFGRLAVNLSNPLYWACYGDLTANGNTGAALQGGVAVRTGGALTTVPEPQTLALSLLALGCAALARRRSRPGSASAALALAVCTAWAGSAQAALVDRGGGMIYDTVQDVTWLQDLNQAQTSGFDSDGFMSWSSANAWAQDLVFGGHDGWRLPTLAALTSLYVDGLGNVPGQPFRPGPFTHLLYEPVAGGAAFWSDATALVLDRPYATAVLFDQAASASNPGLMNGGAFTVPATTMLSAIALRSGDVAGTVPEPRTLALSLLALLAAASTRRRHK